MITDELRGLIGDALEARVNLVLDQKIRLGLLDNLKKELKAEQSDRDRKIDALLQIADGIKKLLDL